LRVTRPTGTRAGAGTSCAFGPGVARGSRPTSVNSVKPAAKYANYVEVGHNAFEFVIEFGQRHDGQPRGRRLRIVTTPVFAKEFLRVLGDSIAKYERAFRPIGEPE
jgi:hypothetical protein